MKTAMRRSTDSVADLVRRHYTIRWIQGLEDADRLERATAAVKEANPGLTDEAETDGEVRLPVIRGIPYLETLIDRVEKLHPTIHAALDRINDDERLRLLSFIDPIRLGCETLGIAVVPAVADEIHRRLEGVVSFDQERYVEVRESGGPLRGINDIRWVTRRPEAGDER